MLRIDKPGIYYDMDPADYYADPCDKPSLTQSIAKILLNRSPAHAALEHPRLRPPPEEDEEAEKYSRAKAIGCAAHAYLIGRGKDIAVGGFKDWRSRDAQAFRLEAESTGKNVILAKHNKAALEMVACAQYQIEAAGLASAFWIGKGEVVLVWKEGPIWFRTMIDWLEGTTVCSDYKTGGVSFNPLDIDAKLVEDGWDIQAAMHERGLDALDPSGIGRRKFYFIAQENSPPYALTPVVLPEAVMTMGRKKLQHAVDIWADCIANNRWPAYPARIHVAQYPGWAETRWLDREIAEHDRADGPYENILAGG